MRLIELNLNEKFWRKASRFWLDLAQKWRLENYEIRALQCEASSNLAICNAEAYAERIRMALDREKRMEILRLSVNEYRFIPSNLSASL